MTTWRASAAITTAQKQRRTIRYLAASIAAVTAVMYLLIGVGVLHVVDEAASDAPPLLDFGLMAGAAFGLGALLLLTMDRRVLWVLGASSRSASSSCTWSSDSSARRPSNCGASPSRPCRSCSWVRSCTSRFGRQCTRTTPRTDDVRARGPGARLQAWMASSVMRRAWMRTMTRCSRPACSAG